MIATAPRYRIVLADDHTIVAEGLSRLLQLDFDLVAQVENGQKAVQAARQFRPDVVLLDISMPVLNGIEAARLILEDDPDIKLVFITMHADAMYVREAFRAGACGYLLKRSAASEIALAIQTVMQGGFYLTPLLSEMSALLHPAEDSAGTSSDLTPRQREVLCLVASGRSAKEIATELNISVKTAEFHKQSLMRKLDVHSVVELTRYAIQHDLTEG